MNIPYDHIQIKLQDNEVRIGFIHLGRELFYETRLMLPDEVLTLETVGEIPVTLST